MFALRSASELGIGGVDEAQTVTVTRVTSKSGDTSETSGSR
jgi:hypothetical protein